MDITQQSEIRRDNSVIWLFAGALFCSATLMFVLQPMFGKALLPLLGGSASVWNTCMVFYQSILFFGYLYAHCITTHLSFRKHILIHACLLIFSLSFLPIGIPEASRPQATDNPSIWLLLTLLTSIGLPFFILSTNSPLLQKWFSQLGHHSSHDPYFLSIASNTGSLIALISYPFILEPSLGIHVQQDYWSAGYVVLFALIALCMLLLKRQDFKAVNVVTSSTVTATRPNLKSQGHWLLLAFVPSSLLLGTTNFISTDIAAVPLLWVIPLALYLLTFIVVFSAYGPKIHAKIQWLQPWIVVAFLLYYFSGQKIAAISLEMLVHLLVFFLSIMVCHGELAKHRPAAEYLTQYYLIMSFGGMLGGIFNTFVAPLIFSAIYEYPLMIIAALLLNPMQHKLKLSIQEHGKKLSIALSALALMLMIGNKLPVAGMLVVCSLATIIMLAVNYQWFKKHVLYLPVIAVLMYSCAAPEKQATEHLLHQSRNFYGVLSVKESADFELDNRREIVHEIYSGTTKHGLQLMGDSNRSCTPNGYYSPHGPLGSIFSSYHDTNRDWQVGVVGLGAGEMAGYSQGSQNWTFFELNPKVVELASNPDYFNYLKDCIHNYTIELGDARITLEKQTQRYDLLVIDAFTSDAIPTHLLTREALELYFARLKPKGLLVFHISNHYLDLKKVLADHAQKLNLSLLIQSYRPKQALPLVYRSDWAIVAKNATALQPLLISREQAWQQAELDPTINSWTDDFTSIMSVWK